MGWWSDGEKGERETTESTGEGSNEYGRESAQIKEYAERFRELNEEVQSLRERWDRAYQREAISKNLATCEKMIDGIRLGLYANKAAVVLGAGIVGRFGAMTPQLASAFGKLWSGITVLQVAIGTGKAIIGIAENYNQGQSIVDSTLTEIEFDKWHDRSQELGKSLSNVRGDKFRNP